MLTKVEVRNNQGVLLTLPLFDISSGYLVTDIQGLDPVKAIIVSSSFAQRDGSQYQSSRREDRNLIFTLGLEPEYASTTVQALRDMLYTFFMPKEQVQLRFFDDNGRTVDISGRIETMDSPIFAREPTATIGIICFDSDFKALAPVQFSGNSTSGTTETTLTYPGTVETGFLFTLNVDRTITSFTIYHRPEDDVTRTLAFAADLVAGDKLEINTLDGSKAAVLTRASVESSILYGVSPYSNWINLFKGDNRFRVHVDGATIPYTLDYTTKYGGL